MSNQLLAATPAAMLLAVWLLGSSLSWEPAEPADCMTDTECERLYGAEED